VDADVLMSGGNTES